MWWADIRDLGASLNDDCRLDAGISSEAIVEPGVTFDTSDGPVAIGGGSKVCAGAVLKGPLIIGEHCMVGSLSMIRGPSLIEDGVRIGYATEIKNALIKPGTLIGPMCFVADTVVEKDVYLGAQVRTSNQRLDRRPISVRNDEREVETGMDKLGCWIGEGTSLGIQVIILPGRVVPPRSLFEPRVTISKNHPPGRYRVKSQLESY